MISYPKAKSEFEAAQMAAKDANNWNEKEREALQLISDFGIWKQKLMNIPEQCPAFPTSIFEKAVAEHEKIRPDVVLGNSPIGKRFTVYPGKKHSLTFYIHEAMQGYNIGIKNSDIK